MDFINGDVYSDEFQQIIILTATEFETIGKMLCHEINGKPLEDVGNIVEISRTILNKFPKIIEVEIESVFAGLKPLTEWKVSADSKGNEKGGI